MADDLSRPIQVLTAIFIWFLKTTRNGAGWAEFLVVEVKCHEISTRVRSPVIAPFYAYFAVFRQPCKTCK